MNLKQERAAMVMTLLSFAFVISILLASLR
jgi:hypothetical protein